MSDRHRATDDGESVIPAQAGIYAIVSDLLDACVRGMTGDGVG